ncbi:MAG: alpha/beta hydrolase family protein [Planctomycetales bacterium]
MLKPFHRLSFLFLALSLAASRPASSDPPGSPAPAATERPAFDLKQLAKPPATFEADGFEADGVRALFYEGEPYQGKSTRVFAWYGAPRVEPGTRVPAMVLIHGGGGSAFYRWVRVWTARGYAALAMDLCGCVPVGTYGNWQRHEQGGPPGWDASFDQLEAPLADHWPYQAVTAIMRGHSLLRSFPEVDPDRIGMTGISWGGYLTCLTAGVDDRFQFAVPVYGCGYLGDNSAWLPRFKTMGTEQAARWLALWDPSQFLPRAKLPILWVNGTNDFAYPMDSWKRSYLLPKGKRTLCLRVRMPHAHGPAGENPEEIHAFANAFFKQGAPLPIVTKQGGDRTSAWVTYESQSPLTKAELNFTRDTGKWQERKWESVPAEIDAKNQRVTAAIPERATVYYINLFQGDLLAVSSSHEELAPQE